VSTIDLTSTDRWPRFAGAATDVGFRAVHALPMRLRAEVIGALNLFAVDTGLLDPQTLRIGQALADVATIGLLQERTIRRSDVLIEQLQTESRPRCSRPDSPTPDPAGCDIGVVTTQPGSKSQQNVQRRGFDLLYTRAVLVKEL